MGGNINGQIIVKLGIAILVLALVDLAYVNWLILGKNIGGETKVIETSTSKVPADIITDYNLTEAATVSASEVQDAKENEPVVVQNEKIVETKTIVEKETQIVIQNAQKEVYIPIGSGNSNSNTWATVAGLEVSVDTNLYQNIDTVNFESSLYVVGGNGKVYAQLYNSTDNHPVWFSEISTSSSTATVLKSANITLDAGAKTYQVQAKTDLTDWAANVGNARLKLVLK